MAKPSYLPAEVTTYWDPDEGRVIQPPGTVLQAVQTSTGDTWASGGANGTTWYNISVLNTNITPKSATSKILIRTMLNIGSGYWEIQGRYTRNGTPIGLGGPRGSRTQCTFIDNRYEDVGGVRNGWGAVSAEYLDSPATTSAITYGVDVNGYSTYVVGLNYNPYSDVNNADYFGTPISTMTLMEISG